MDSKPLTEKNTFFGDTLYMLIYRKSYKITMVTSTTVRVPNNGRKRGSMGHLTIFKNPSNIKRGSVDTASCGSNILTSKLGGSNNSLGKRESINSLGRSCSTSHNSLGRFGKHGDRNSIQVNTVGPTQLWNWKTTVLFDSFVVLNKYFIRICSEYIHTVISFFIILKKLIFIFISR